MLLVWALLILVSPATALATDPDAGEEADNSATPTGPQESQERRDRLNFINNTPWYDPNWNACAAPTSETKPGAPTIVIDPGHSGKDIDTIDKETGLRDHDYPNHPELEDMWDVAVIVKEALNKIGYNVTLTKNSAEESVPLLKRAKIAMNAQASLAVSLHTMAGKRSDGAKDFRDWNEIYVQRTDSQRTSEKTGQTKKFGDPESFNGEKTAKLSAEYGENFRKARDKAQGVDNVDVTVNSFDDREGLDPGNLSMVQLFADKVPWVYNEAGGNSAGRIGLNDADKKKYAEGIIEGVKQSVPSKQVEDDNLSGSDTGNDTGSEDGSTPNGTPQTGAIQMERVDTSGFNPDPKAQKMFTDNNLPKLKKYIPLYVKAAQLEGVPQNWEILAGLHGTETNYAYHFKSNPLGYTGPYQESPAELSEYLDDNDYKDVLKTLVTPGGQAINTDKLNEDQFIVLSRLALHRWVRQALGNDYDKLKQGPIQFAPPSTSHTWYKILHRWNPGAEMYQAFNGFDKDNYPMGMATEHGGGFTLPGAATVYCMLKNWEAGGGMATIAGTGVDCQGVGSTGSVDCQTATGSPKILCEAKKYDTVSYELSGRAGHQGAANWHKSCPVIGPSCVLDCSGIISVAIYDAFGYEPGSGWTTWTMMSDTKNWQRIPTLQMQPGDAIILHNGGHVEIVMERNGDKIKTFGAHNPNKAQPDQVGELDYYTVPMVEQTLRYIGPGST